MEIILSPLLLFDPQGKRQRQPRSSRQTDAAADRGQRLFCVRCRHVITHQRYHVAMNGVHTRHFTNPHGIAFHIACFREASGCTEFGAPTTEFTWFPGYAWRVANCAKCDVHLGWLFTSAVESFYGLIVDRLTAEGKK